VKVALSVWHDESKGLIHGKEPQEIIDIDPDSDDDHSNENADNNTHSAQGGQSDPSTSPPSSTSERTSHTIDDDDSIDIDAIILDDQQNRQQARASSSAAPQSMSKASVNLDEDFDVAMWEDLAFADDPLPPPVSRPPPSKPSAIVDQDEDMWDLVRELEAEKAVSTAGEKVTDVSSIPVSQQITTHSDFDDWDDMYA
jgi:replication fork protection complex subunit Csm3/Swi3